MPGAEQNLDSASALNPDRTEGPLACALASLEFLVLERTEKGELKVCGRAPEWAVVMGENEIENRIAESPFLSSFVEEVAVPFWRGKATAPVSSGIWRECVDFAGGAHFEAMAINGEHGESLLVVKRLGDSYDELQALTQRANENVLEHRQLSREVQKKDVLLKCIVHDLNNPLGAVLLNLELLSASEDAGVKASASLALESARRQRNLIRSIADVFSSDLSRMGGDGKQAEPLSALVNSAEHVVQMHLNEAMRRSISISLEDGVSNCVPLDRKLRGDVDAYARIIENLVLNALRYAPKDSTVTVALFQEEGGIQVEVNDCGPSVEPQEVAGLFDPFTQGTTNRGSMGLGLYFCRMTIEQWGGTIRYRPNSDGGAQFVFTLPWMHSESAT